MRHTIERGYARTCTWGDRWHQWRSGTCLDEMAFGLTVWAATSNTVTFWRLMPAALVRGGIVWTVPCAMLAAVALWRALRWLVYRPLVKGTPLLPRRRLGLPVAAAIAAVWLLITGVL